MRLYKYRSLAKFEYVCDIILNQRLHCATYESLNDPFEGLFVTKIYPGLRDRQGRRLPLPLRPLRKHKSVRDIIFGPTDKIRICSLSSSFSEVRLWSHYADGHRGIVIEIDFSGIESIAHKVNYFDELPLFGSTELTRPGAEEVLSCKTKHWEYEAEYRIFHESEYFDISGRLKGIYLGSRISDTHHKLLTKIIRDEIPIYKTKINREKIAVELKESV